jgi:hypothetical protein
MFRKVGGLQTELFRDFGAECCRGLETHGELCLLVLLLLVVGRYDDEDEDDRVFFHAVKGFATKASAVCVTPATS